MENTVIKVLTREHGAKVIEWWKSQGVYTHYKEGVACMYDNDMEIYYGVINGKFNNYNIEDVSSSNTKIIELPREEFDMTTNEGRLAYAKRNYPVGTRYIPLDYKTGHTYPQSCKSRFTPQVTISPYANYHNDLDAGVGYIYVHKLNKWAEIIKEEKMETQKLTRAGLKEIHSVACSAWREKLENYGKRNILEDYIELTQDEVDEMFDARVNSIQYDVLSTHLKENDGSVDVASLQLKNGSGFFKDEKGFLTKRIDGEYENKSFFLNDNYNWEIIKDSNGMLCLIPTKKK
jgi:hypothetical protein